MTFTNRLGENIFIKTSDEDEPKVLWASDYRVSFLYREASDLLQVRLFIYQLLSLTCWFIVMFYI